MADRSIKVILSAQIADFKRQMDEASKATSGTASSLDALADKAAVAAKRADEAAKKAKEELGDSAGAAQTAMGRMVQSAELQREAWDRAGTTLTAFGAATVAALGFSAKAAIDWESAWAGVAKTVDGSDAQMAALEGSLRDLAKTLPASHQEIAAVAEAAGQLGVGIDGVASFTKTMIDLGETTNLSADEAATAIAQMANVMGLDLSGGSDDVQRFGATLVELGNNGASTEAEIVSMAQRIAGSGKLVGATSGEVLALANALASMGVTAELGGGVASRVVQDIYTAVQNGGDELQGFAQVAGMSAADFAKAFGEDPIRAMGSFATGLNDVEASGGNVVQTLTDLGFKSTEEQRILLQLKASGDLLNESLDMQAEAWASNTALIAEAEKRYDTTEAKIQVAKNSINDAAITIGESFLPAVAGAADAVAGLAQWFEALPQPVQTAAAGLGGLVGVTSLAAGGFLLMFPRVVETVKAFRDLTASAPGAASAVGKAAGVAAAAMAVMVASAAIPKWGTNVSEGAGVATQALLDVASGAKTADEAFASTLANGSWKDWFTGNEVTSVQKAFETLKDPGVAQNIDNIASSVLTLGQTTSTSRLQAQELFSSMDEGLSSLVLSGSADEAAEALKAMGIALEGNEDILPLYADALASADVQQQLAGDSASGMAGDLDGLAASTAEVDEELQKWLEDVAAADASFVDAFGAYDTLIQKNKDAAQATADATESSEDSWEDFYDGFSVSVEEYLAELQRQVDAQTTWEQNLLLLSGRASQGVIDELYAMGAEGAPLVAQLVNASDAELERMEGLFGQRSATATGAFANTLYSAAPVIQAASAQLGAGAAAEIAAKLASGTATVEQIMAEYDLKISGTVPTVDVDTSGAQAKLRQLNETLRGIQGFGAVQVGQGTVLAPGLATGGPIFGPGTETSDSVLARLSNNEHVWSASEVKGAGGHRVVAAMRAAARSGSIPGFRDGGTPAGMQFSTPARTASTPSVHVAAPSLDGARLTGTLDLGNGLTGLIDARVDAGLAQQRRDLSGMRGGR